MNRIYIGEHGDDKNDGRSRETPIYSWKRAVKLCDGNSEMRLMEGQRCSGSRGKLKNEGR
jgi:hypothetical protein